MVHGLLPTPSPYGGYVFMDEFGNIQNAPPEPPSIRARTPTFREDLKDILQGYGMSRDMSETLLGGKVYGNQADAIQRMVGREGLLGILPVTGGILSGGQAVKDYKEGNMGSAAGNALFAALDLGLSGFGARQAYKTARQSPDLIELTQTPQNREYFQGILKEAQDSQGPLGYQVSVYQPEEYKGMQMIASPNADAGFAITPKGEIVSLVKNKNSQAKQFAKRALNYAYGDGKGNNGVFLNAFDTELTRLYRNAGFKPVSRTAFDEELFRGEIGDKAVDEFMEATKRFNDGRPDIVFMVRDPNVATRGSTKVQNFPLPQGEPKGTYDEATADLLTEMMRLGYIDELGQRNYR